jgi:hypothetical protein
MPGGTIRAQGNMLYTFVIAPTITPTGVAPDTSVEETFTISGLQTGDCVDLYPTTTAPAAGVALGSVRVSAANTLAIQFVNSTASTVVPLLGQVQLIVNRPENVLSLLPTAIG